MRSALTSLLSDRNAIIRATSEIAMMAGMMISSGLGTSKEMVLSTAYAFAGTDTLNDGL